MPVRVAKFTCVDASAKLARAYVGADPSATAPLLHVPRRADCEFAGHHPGFSDGEWRRWVEHGNNLAGHGFVGPTVRRGSAAGVFIDEYSGLSPSTAKKFARAVARTRTRSEFLRVNRDVFDRDAVRNPQPALGIYERFTSRNPHLRRKNIDKMNLDTATMWRAHAIMARAAAETYSRKWIDSKLAALTKRIAYLEGERYGLAYRDAALRSDEPTS